MKAHDMMRYHFLPTRTILGLQDTLPFMHDCFRGSAAEHNDGTHSTLHSRQVQRRSMEGLYLNPPVRLLDSSEMPAVGDMVTIG